MLIEIYTDSLSNLQIYTFLAWLMWMILGVECVKLILFFFFSILHYLMQMLLRCVCIGYCKLCFEFKVSVCKKVMRSYYCEMEFLVLKTLFQTSKTVNRTDPWYVYKSAGAYILF